MWGGVGGMGRSLGGFVAVACVGAAGDGVAPGLPAGPGGSAVASMLIVGGPLDSGGLSAAPSPPWGPGGPRGFRLASGLFLYGYANADPHRCVAIADC